MASWAVYCIDAPNTEPCTHMGIPCHCAMCLYRYPLPPTLPFVRVAPHTSSAPYAVHWTALPIRKGTGSSSQRREGEPGVLGEMEDKQDFQGCNLILHRLHAAHRLPVGASPTDFQLKSPPIGCSWYFRHCLCTYEWWFQVILENPSVNNSCQCGGLDLIAQEVLSRPTFIEMNALKGYENGHTMGCTSSSVIRLQNP